MYRIILFAIAAGFEFLAYYGDNYLDWSLQVKAILTDQQLWEIVEGADDPSKEEKNDMALGLIWYSCGQSSLGNEIWSVTSAKIAWDTLAAICALPKSKLHIGISRSLPQMHMLKHF